ncbi:MAG: aminopeptidase [Verrucomicrobiota bacterium]
MPRSFSLLAPVIAALLLLPSCQTFRFYGQAIGGQTEILRKSRPNPQVIGDPATSPGLRQQLVAVEKIRRFASDHLSLPGDESYGKYADLGRKHVVWVLYAAPEFSLKPKTWHYPAVGEMDYRGYFREQDSVDLARQLRTDGHDVFIGGVDAYSTLGWFHDPVLNTFVDYPDIDLAETIFHELTHRKVFHRGDTVFNESLANTVAEEGVKRWLRHEGRLADLRKYQGRLVKRREFYHEIDRSRCSLEALYASGQPAPVMRQKKAGILAKLRDQFRELRRRWGGHGLESWLHEDINNGHIVSLNLYADKMPAFEKLLAECGGNLDLFYKKADKLKLSDP